MRSDTLVCRLHFFHANLAGQDVMVISLLVWSYVAALGWLVSAFYWKARGGRD